MSKSNRSSKQGKADTRPDKPKGKFPPFGEFPLYPHPLGYWAKKIRGKVHYFGRWGRVKNGKMVRVEGNGWREALEEYKQQAEALRTGRKPREQSDGLKVAELCDRFVVHCDTKVEAGEMVQRTRDDYKRVANRIVKLFGKGRLVEDLQPDDFAELRAEMAKTRKAVALNGEITRARVLFNFAHKNSLIPAPVQYGVAFDRPGKKALREAKAKNGARMLEPAECRKLIDEAQSPELRAMILLALNCGFGNNDCAVLPTAAVNLDKGWIDFPRPKTGVDRRCPLWPETVAALRVVLDRRRQDRDSVFVTKYNNSYADDQAAITKEFRKLLNATGLYRPGISFSALRHVFRTIADGCGDFPAIDRIMGHARDDMASNYRQRIDDDRLEAVAEHMRSWIFGKPEQPKKRTTARRKATKATSKAKQQSETSDNAPRLRVFAG